MAQDVAITDAMDVDGEDEQMREWKRIAAANQANVDAIEREMAEEREREAQAAAEEGEIDENEPIPSKVHVRGLDQFKPEDIRDWLSQYGVHGSLGRIEWIDDTSANLIYSNAETAADALTILSVEMAAKSTDLREAKPYSTRPQDNLEIRQAFSTDVKKKGAAKESRFYLLNPEHDPEMRRDRKRGRFDDSYRTAGYKRDRYEDLDRSSENKRGRFEPDPRSRFGGRKPHWDESMYDEAPQPQGDEQQGDLFPNRRRRSLGAIDRPLSSRSQQADLFDGSRRRDIQSRRSGRLQDRSASPVRHEDGRYGFEEQPYRRTARRRSITPRQRSPQASNGRPRSLSQDRISMKGNANKELFPDKGTVHRRSDAQDLRREPVERVFEEPVMPQRRTLFERIENGPAPIARDEDRGFMIRGASQAGQALAKELFPEKQRNSTGSFDGRIKGAAQRRRGRAEDLF